MKPSGAPVVVKPCSHGLGVFATENIVKGEVIAVIEGGSIDRAALTKIHVPIGGGLYWGPVPADSPTAWSNYLDNGGQTGENVRLTRFSINNGIPKASLIATKNIPAGSELLLNYKQVMEHLRDI